MAVPMFLPLVDGDFFGVESPPLCRGLWLSGVRVGVVREGKYFCSLVPALWLLLLSRARPLVPDGDLRCWMLCASLGEGCVTVAATALYPCRKRLAAACQLTTVSATNATLVAG